MLKRILDKYEKLTHQRLEPVCISNGAQVFAKVRVADTVSINDSGISDQLFSYALQSHFDFVVADDKSDPLFAVEFDGESHKSTIQKQRDEKKNSLCSRFGLPLLRINSHYLSKKYRTMYLLEWFIETWFLSKAFNEAQWNGHIPPDEPFLPSSCLKIMGRDENCPLDLSASVRCKINNLWVKGKCAQLAPSSIVGIDDSHNYYAISYLSINDEVGIVSRTGMRNQSFPVVISEVLQQIAEIDLYEKLERYLVDGSGAQPLKTISGLVEEFCHNYTMLSRVSVGPFSAGTAI